jgi:hypothetical protein
VAFRQLHLEAQADVVAREPERAGCVRPMIFDGLWLKANRTAVSAKVNDGWSNEKARS